MNIADITHQGTDLENPMVVGRKYVLETVLLHRKIIPEFETSFSQNIGLVIISPRAG